MLHTFKSLIDLEKDKIATRVLEHLEEARQGNTDHEKLLSHGGAYEIMQETVLEGALRRGMITRHEHNFCDIVELLDDEKYVDFCQHWQDMLESFDFYEELKQYGY